MEKLIKSKSSKKTININLPWVEKYRPKDTSEILFDPFIRHKILTIQQNKSIPNMILTGEPGTGKTSTILCMIADIYSKKELERDVLELNASDDRGLNIINNTIIPFCKKIPSSSKHKLIILDESDSITLKAQNLLANIISKYKKNTRFVFICNDCNKIIESIQSNCITINFSNISKKNIKEKVKNICEEENIDYDDNSIKELIFVSDNNIRQVINNLECIFYCCGKLDLESIYKIVDKPKPFYIKEILKECLNGNLYKSMEILVNLHKNGYSPNDILQTFMKFLLEDEFELDKKIRIKLYEIVSLSYIRINDGIDTMLQLCGCLSKIFIFLNSNQI